MSTVVIEHPTQQVPAAGASNNAVALVTYPVELAKVRELETAYSGLTISGIDDKKGMLAVDDARKEVKRLKIAVENRREELKADILERGRHIDAAARTLREPLEALERSLAAKQKVITDEVARLEREAAEKLRQQKEVKLRLRLEMLKAVNVVMMPQDVEAMSDDEFVAFHAEKSIEHRDRLQREAAEQKRRDNESARQREEDERLKAERRKLDEERAELEKVRKEQVEREAEAQRKIDEEKDRLAREERERQAELERQRQLEYDKQLQAEQAKAKAEREEAERVRAEQLRPDKERLLEFADTVEALRIPICTTTLPEVERLIRFRLFHAAVGIRDIVKEKVR